MTPADVTVVIPAIDEESVITGAVRSAIEAGANEVIVVDGGSRDATPARAAESGAAKIVHSLPGRGIQLNAGGLVANGTMLLFLHADNRLVPQALAQLCRHTEPVWGAFRQRIDSPRRAYRWIERGNALRVRLLGVPFGDQATFVRRDVFEAHGGFAEVPLMEDVELAKRLRKIAKPILLEGPVEVSPRRWQQRGVVRQTLRNWSIQAAYKSGASPETLWRWYR